MFLCLAECYIQLSADGAAIIVERRGGKVAVVKYSDGSWQLQVDEKPYFIKGVVFEPVKIGEDPAEGTMRDWMTYDDNKNGKNDIAFDTWLAEDSGKKPVGDFQLLKEMGVNTIRVYHLPSDNPILGDIYENGAETTLHYDHAVNKALLRSLYKDYGIRVIIGNYIGGWTIGSGVKWEKGTDYSNPEDREAIKRSVKAMVLDNKDEPYVLFWLLGNENNIASWSNENAGQKPEDYASLVGELADMIHTLDPEHPVAVCEGDRFNTLKLYPRLAKNIDIIGYNSYRGEKGFGFLWQEAKQIFDRPIYISEFGAFAYQAGIGEDEELQRSYIQGNWEDIILQSRANQDTAKHRMGNSIGGTVFDWLDRWYMDGTPYEHNPGTRGWPTSPDHLRHEEWFGVVSMADGADTLERHRRKAYYYLQSVWVEK
jgi:beta-glucuronidase